jgi:hypothetical protein
VIGVLRSVGSKVAWVGRTASMVFGLALVLALVVGVATAAFGANGDFFKVGKPNFASAVSVLDKSGAGPALRLLVDSGAPLAVNSSGKVDNLNADRVDGKDSSALMPAQTYVVEHEEVIEPPTVAISRAILCDDGDVPISGGFGSLDPESQVISSRRIVLGERDAWLVAVRSSESDTFLVEAVCADFPPMHQ